MEEKRGDGGVRKKGDKKRGEKRKDDKYLCKLDLIINIKRVKNVIYAMYEIYIVEKMK